MQLSQFQGQIGFVLSGECPHCHGQAAFPTVTQVFFESSVHSVNNEVRRILFKVLPLISITSEVFLLEDSTNILIAGNAAARSDGNVTHYPLGVPNDAVAEEIPDEIKPDFQEALRCRFVNAYNATAEMCRRALEASCIQQGAPADVVLSKMIDWLHDQRKITTPLRDMAHKIKLGGNLGAHPSDKRLTEEDADAVLAFTDEYFQHVYVTPARMAKHDFSKSKKKP